MADVMIVSTSACGCRSVQAVILNPEGLSPIAFNGTGSNLNRSGMATKYPALAKLSASLFPPTSSQFAKDIYMLGVGTTYSLLFTKAFPKISVRYKMAISVFLLLGYAR